MSCRKFYFSLPFPRCSTYLGKTISNRSLQNLLHSTRWSSLSQPVPGIQARMVQLASTKGRTPPQETAHVQPSDYSLFSSATEKKAPTRTRPVAWKPRRRYQVYISFAPLHSYLQQRRPSLDEVEIISNEQTSTRRSMTTHCEVESSDVRRRTNVLTRLR